VGDELGHPARSIDQAAFRRRQDDRCNRRLPFLLLLPVGDVVSSLAHETDASILGDIMTTEPDKALAIR